MKKYLLFYLFFFIFPWTISAQRLIVDTPNSDISSLFGKSNTVYVIRHKHHFSDSITVPSHSEIRFEGGSLSGRIAFNETKLTGDVKLQGSHISGTIRNRSFNAAWLCYRDGKTDDAGNINQILTLCKDIYFPKGVYWMESSYQPDDLEGNLKETVKCHIGINKSDVTLRGEQGTNFVTEQVLGMITVYTQPNQIDRSIGKIRIENIKFTTRNDGKNFHEFIHVIKLMGVNGIIIRGCEFEDFWGDGICLSHYGDTPQTGERTRNQNVKILNNTIIGGNHHNTRNGISIVNGKNVLVRNNNIRNTSRKDMPGGIDVEPNNSAYTVENIRIEKNTFEGIWGTVGAVGIVLLRDQAPAYNVCVAGNTIRDCSCGISIAIKTEMSSGKILIKENFIAGDTRPYNFVGSGSSKDWIICDNVFERPCLESMPGNIKVDNLKVKNNKKKD